MKMGGDQRRMLCIGIGALIAGCGEAQPPAAAPGAIWADPSLVGTTRHRQEDGIGIGSSWMSRIANSQNLLYVSNVNSVIVYSYPLGRVLGMLHGFNLAEGMCVDGQGEVFVTDEGYNKIFVYRHGSQKRLRTLMGWSGPVGCSVDPTTGNLAASSQGGTDNAVAIYPLARGNPTIYKNPAFQEYFWCGYDANGNLFVDGQSSANQFEFAELPKAGRTLKSVTLNQSMGFPGGVQWDGAYVAVGSYYPPPSGKPIVYQFAVKGSRGTKVGTTPLSGAVDVKQFWLENKYLIAPNEYDTKSGARSDVLFYNYRTGGRAVRKLTKDVTAAQGVVVSSAPR
jgi:hypothetical protein